MASFRDSGRAMVSGTVSLQDVVALVLLDFFLPVFAFPGML